MKLTERNEELKKLTRKNSRQVDNAACLFAHFASCIIVKSKWKYLNLLHGGVWDPLHATSATQKYKSFAFYSLVENSETKKRKTQKLPFCQFDWNFWIQPSRKSTQR